MVRLIKSSEKPSARVQAEQALRQAHEIFMRLTGPDLGYRIMRPLLFWMWANIPAIPGRMFKQMVNLGISPSRRQAS